MTLAENLRAARNAKGMTQEELAEYVGVTQSAITFFETGRKVPSVAILESIADVLQCSTDSLLGRKDK